MSRGHRWLAGTAVGVLVVGAAAGVAWSQLRDDPYTHTLVRFDDDRGEANRYTNLEDGDAQLSVGSPDGHRLVVQWRDPDGHGWTAPETVWTDEVNQAIENTVRYGGGTVAIVETYTPDTSDDSDIRAISVAVVCRDLTCEATQTGGINSEAQVLPDGSLVYVGQNENAVQWWSEDEGFYRTVSSGRPASNYPRVVVSGPVLVPDGSLRLVRARQAGARCTFDLLVSEPGAAALTSAVRETRRLRDPGSYDCQTTVDTFSSDWLAVSSYDPQTPTFWFVRDGASWTTTDDDPSGLRTIDVARNDCCDTSVVGFVHWNDLAYGSPDGRRIQIQAHLLGEETWREPQLLDAAPPGYRCTWLEGADLGDGFLLLMTCHEAGHPVRDRHTGNAYAAAASTDLEHWETAWIEGVRRRPAIGHDGLRVGELRWTPEGGFERR